MRCARSHRACLKTERIADPSSAMRAALLADYRISRVAADPSPVLGAMIPAGWTHVAYVRLHGSPRPYWSRYDADGIAAVAATIERLSAAEQVWCVFDNTASGAAIENAWELRERLIDERWTSPPD
jgi:uncharacterized protein YecE (DUF72 family)